jgi:integrase
MGLRPMRGKWQYRFRLHGHNVCQTTDLEATEPNRPRAERLEKAHRDRILKGEAPPRRLRNRQFPEAVVEFLRHCQVQHQDHPNTFARVKTSMASLLEFFRGRSVASIRVPDLEAFKVWRLEMKIKPVTLRNDLVNLSKFFRWAIRMEIAHRNPVEQVEKPSDKDAVRMRVISIREETLYFEQAELRSQDLADVARLILLQGCRPEEIVTLEAGCVDLERRTLFIARGKRPASRRTIRLAAESAQILERRIASLPPGSRYLFPRRRIGKTRKGHLSLSGLINAHNDVLARLARTGVDLPCVLYDLRHTFATRKAELGMPLGTLAAVLGHSSIRMVMKYVHPTQQHQDEEMDRLDAVERDLRAKVKAELDRERAGGIDPT